MRLFPAALDNLLTQQEKIMIHPTALIDPKAELDSDVSVGAYSVIGAGVQIGRGTTIAPHVVIEGPTRIGQNNHIFPFASLGAIPQDKKYGGEDTTLEIGDNNTIREFVTFNRGTVQDIGKTVLGDGNWIMAYVHLAHDCVIGNNTTFANNVILAGHVHIEDHVVMGGAAWCTSSCASVPTPWSATAPASNKTCRLIRWWSSPRRASPASTSKD